jgi:hypothetical protein
MTLGILGAAHTPPLMTLKSFRGYSGLGNVGGLGAVVPASCWSTPGFKECNEQSWKVAEDKCIRQGLATSQYGGDWVKCKSEQAADYSYFGCALRICPPPPVKRPTSSGGWTWGKTATPNPGIKAFQDHLNVCLDRNGFKRIVADGYLGPATCGAFKTVAGSCPDQFASDPIGNIGICQSFTNPTKLGATSPVKDPVSDEAKKLDQQFGQLPWQRQDPRAANLQLGLNQQLTGHEYLPVPVSGQLDATMCGGMRFLDQNTGSQWMPSWGQNCQAFIDPRRKQVTAPPAPKPITPGPATGPGGQSSSPVVTAAKSNANMLIAGGLLTAALVGGYAYYQSKTGGA